MRYLRFYSMVVFILLWVGGYAQLSQSLEDADTLTVGSRFRLIVKGEFPIKQVVVPDSIDGFRLIQQEIIRNKGEKDFSRITLAPLKTGSLSFPQLRVIPGVASSEEYRTDAFRIEVLAVRAESDTLLRDIKPLKKYPFQKPWWLYLLLILTVLIWVIIALVRYLRSKPKAEPKLVRSLPDTPVLTPWEQALAELGILRTMQKETPEELREFHYRLALILRCFLERQYRIQAVEMTSFEIRDALRTKHLPLAVELVSFLQYCDRVKFAKYFPETDMIEEKLAWLEGYLNGHRPVAAQTQKAEGEDVDPAR